MPKEVRMVGDQSGPTKAQLVEAMRASGVEVLSVVRRLPPTSLERGRYENGWTGRQIVAHLAAIEWTYPRVIEVARQGLGPQSRIQAPPTREAKGGIDAYNERQVAKRADATVAALLAEFEQNRAATIAAVEQLEDELLGTPVRAAGGTTGSLAAVLAWVAVGHVRGHLADIVGEL
jgi:DinB family protein